MKYIIALFLMASSVFADGWRSTKTPEMIFYGEGDGQKWIAEQEARNNALAKAAASRVLTRKEMEELLQTGYHIFVKDGVSYNKEEMQIRYMKLLETQVRIRLYAESLKGCK